MRIAGLAALVVIVGCGSGSGLPASSSDGGGSLDSAGPDAGSPDTAGPDASSDSRGPTDANRESAADAAPFVNVDMCTAAGGTVAWMASIAGQGAPFTLGGVAVGPTNDAIVADQSGMTYEQHRWDEMGTVVSVHGDALGSYVGPMSTSNLYVDAQNHLFYGTLFTGLAQGADTGAQLTFTMVAPDGSTIAADMHTSSMPTANGPPSILVFDSGGDSGGGLHGAVTMASPAYFPAGVYCYGSNGSFSGVSAAGVTATLAARDFEWPNHDAGLFLAKRVSASLDLGCGMLTVPPEGATVLAKLDSGGGCLWSKVLALPTQAVTANDVRLGVDGSIAVAVVYAGTIDFGGGPLPSQGTSSLGVARFDATGALLWAKSFGGSGSSFVLGSLGVNANGVLGLAAGYAGAVDLGGGALAAGDDTFIAAFDSGGTLKWSRAVSVGTQGMLMTAVGPCGVVVSTDSPSVDLGTGPLASGGTIGVAGLGL